MNGVGIKRGLWTIKMYNFRLESKNTSPQDFSVVTLGIQEEDPTTI